MATAFSVVPLCIAYGVVAFAPLGAEWAGKGIAAALIAAVVVPLVAAALGLRQALVFSPWGISAVVLASFLSEFALLPEVQSAGPPLLVIAAVCYLLMVGVFETLLGAAHVGRLARYLPAPVMAGLQCGAALVLIRSQLAPLLGVDGAGSVADAFAALAHEPRRAAWLIATVTIALALWLPRAAPRLPAFAIALAAAAALQALLVAAGFAAHLGGTLGALQWALPETRNGGWSTPWRAAWPHLPQIAAWALTAAVMTTAATLRDFRKIAAAGGDRFDPDREWLRIGAANVVASLAGGLHSGVAVRPTQTLLQHGGRGVGALLLVAVVVAALALAGAPFLAAIPRAAVAALLLPLALSLIDPWTLRIAGQLLADPARRTRDVAGMLGTVAVVCGVAVATNLLLALGVGIVIAVVSFIWRMSRSIIRRTYTLREVQSRTVRAPELRGLLYAHGQRVVVFELEGPLFFGTAEKFTDTLVELAARDTLILIADLQRVSDVDSTAVRLLSQVQRKLNRAGKRLALSGLPTESRLARLLGDFGLDAQDERPDAPPIKRFPDADQALEWAEDRLLESLGPDVVAKSERGLESLDMVRGFSAAEIAAIGRYLVRQQYHAGDVVFSAGATSRELFAIVSGRASVTLAGAGGSGSATRLVTFSPGAVFGEFALLDRQPRSATVRADTDLSCFVLTADAFLQLQRDQPACAIRLLANLGRELSQRLRNANQTIQVLAR